MIGVQRRATQATVGIVTSND